MDHPFLSHRQELSNIQTATQILKDVMTLMTIDVEDKSRLLQRKEVLIANPQVRASVCARSDRLGLLLDDVDGLVKSKLNTHQTSWESFLTGGKSPADLAVSIETLLTELRHTRQGLDSTEVDGGSSSYSDYSASDTESSGDEDDEGTEEHESSE